LRARLAGAQSLRRRADRERGLGQRAGAGRGGPPDAADGGGRGGDARGGPLRTQRRIPGVTRGNGVHAERIAGELGLRPAQVRAALDLLGEGNTIPFVARYRKEATGELDEVQLRDVRDRNEYLVELDARRATILTSIEEQGKLDAELRGRIERADSKSDLEDLYRPYKPKRRTRAT